MSNPAFYSTSKQTNQDYYEMGLNQIEALTRYNRAQTMLFMLHLNHNFYIFIIDININLYITYIICVYINVIISIGG